MAKFAKLIYDKASKAAAAAVRNPAIHCKKSEVFQQSSSKWRSRPFAKDAFEAALAGLIQTGVVTVRGGPYKSTLITMVGPPPET